MSLRSLMATSCFAAALAMTANSQAATHVSICTSFGRIVLEVDETLAPKNAESFLNFVRQGHYNQTVFHRVMADFIIQGGGYDRDLNEIVDRSAIENESRNGLSNIRGSVAAARTDDPHSAGAQFFINLADNINLDGTEDAWGFTVFGSVIEGMNIVDEIAALPTGPGGGLARDVPDPLVTILSASVLHQETLNAIDEPDLAAALLARIDAAQEMNDPQLALEWLGHYRATCSPLGADLLLAEAQSAHAMDQPLLARNTLEEFFATTPDTHPYHAQAQTIYDNVAAELQETDIFSFGNCIAPSAPAVPDGTNEDLNGMIEGQTAVQTFMSLSTSYLNCLDEFIEDSINTQTKRDLAVQEYNSMVEITQSLGDAFNEQVRAFRARQ